jgi:hypothetical protein
MAYLLQIPNGTQVVVNADRRVGVVKKVAGDDTYLVRFPDGHEETFGRQELSLRKHLQKDVIAGEVRPELLDVLMDERVIYRCVVGSRSFGLETEDSDVDRRGIYLAPAELQWSLQGAPPYLERHAEDTYWELQHFLVLALKANPNALECLYSPEVERITPEGEELVALRGAFLSRLVHQTYNGYVLSQFKKMESDLRSKGAPKWKHAMHLLRLLLSGIALLRTGDVLIDVGDQRERLLEVKSGSVPWDRVEAWRLQLHREFDAALALTSLPEQPDVVRVNDFLVRMRRRAADAG